jgi:hypothetical protein
MTRKIVFTAILVTFISLLQYGCKTTEVKKEPAKTEQPKVTIEAQKPAAVTPAPAAVTPAPAAVKPAPAAVTPAPAAGGKFVLRVNCGNYDSAYTDKAGNVWQADQDFSAEKKWGADGGSVISRPGLNIPNTDCPTIYESERYSMDDYKFAVPAGKYTVKLHFAETYEGISGVGERVFSVSINGKEVLKNVDPYKDAGEFNKPSVKTLNAVEPKDGQIVIGFTYGVENPQICGLEVLSE